MRRRRPHSTLPSSLALLAALVVSGSMVAAASNSAANVTPSALAAVALQEAAGAGDGGANSAEVVLSTRQQAEARLGAGMVSNERVYLVEIQGHFTLLDASRPPGAHPPQGDYLGRDLRGVLSAWERHRTCQACAAEWSAAALG